MYEDINEMMTMKQNYFGAKYSNEENIRENLMD